MRYNKLGHTYYIYILYIAPYNNFVISQSTAICTVGMAESSASAHAQFNELIKPTRVQYINVKVFILQRTNYRYIPIIFRIFKIIHCYRQILILNVVRRFKKWKNRFITHSMLIPIKLYSNGTLFTTFSVIEKKESSIQETVTIVIESQQ